MRRKTTVDIQEGMNSRSIRLDRQAARAVGSCIQQCPQDQLGLYFWPVLELSTDTTGPSICVPQLLGLLQNVKL